MLPLTTTRASATSLRHLVAHPLRRHASTSTSTPATAPLASFMSSTTVIERKGRIVILGSGWAGYNLARKIDKSFYDVTVVSPNSYFSFTPFLASTTTGTLEFRCATEPVRSIEGVEYAQARAESVDFANKTVTVAPASLSDHTKVQRDKSDATDVALLPEQKLSKNYDIPYDALVIATGCRSASFGTPGVAEHAMFLKDVRDARRIRLRLLQCLELASEPNITDDERRALLSFRVVGGGPTGVEFAAELCDFITEDVDRLYPRLRGLASITLYDVAPGILMSFDGELRHYAEKKFARDGVTVRGNSHILAAGPDWIELKKADGTVERVQYGMLVWSTGLSVNPFVNSLKGVSKDPHTHSIHVDPYLRVIDDQGKPMPHVFAVGDNSTPDSGQRLPATAQVASQMAHYMHKKFKRLSMGKAPESIGPFSWKNKGSMVFVGKEQALVDRSGSTVEGPKSKLSGFAAWFIWRSYYMTLSMSWRNQILVPMYWTLAYFFGRDVTRF
ncbi:putative NADH dehydrogenase [Vanrija pseudolonga]|uniref:NADH dehydrogenase n=1 Tax=Vanrija pseudolonga TaxID=143232 RepID=A0AAF1BH26_9TREE|nr:putative NADH dehydrogenase [Vanrija pseudolonga]